MLARTLLYVFSVTSTFFCWLFSNYVEDYTYVLYKYENRIPFKVIVLHVIRKNKAKKHTVLVTKNTNKSVRAKHFKDDGTWVCPVCLYHAMFLKEEMKEAWAIVENASIS